MDDGGWGEGYSTQEAYTPGFYPELAPEHLNHVCLLNGVEPVPRDRPFLYCELGCGLGATLSLLAAANPSGHFFGVDFMPAHIATAARQAEQAGLANLTLLEKSFAELASAPTLLPAFDFIVLHGVYSWVSPENRRLIVDFVARHLRPGGVLYVSYNAMPGWAAARPMRRLVSSQAARESGEARERMVRVQAWLKEMSAARSGYLQLHPALLDQFGVLESGDEPLTYLIHEYLNAVAEPMYHADVAAEFEPAKLDYVGQAVLSVSFQSFSEPQQKLLDDLPDGSWRETIKDFIVNTRFRKDVYVRGRRAIPKPRRQAALRDCHLGLVVPRGRASLGILNADGSLQPADDGGPQAEVLDRLACSPCSFRELSHASLFGGDVELVSQVAALMVGVKHGAVCPPPDLNRQPQSARGLNRLIAESARSGVPWAAMAAQHLATGVAVSPLESLVYGALTDGPVQQANLQEITARVASWLAVDARPLAEQGSLPGGMPALAGEVERILRSTVPWWRTCGML